MMTRVSLKYFASYCSLLGNMLEGKGIVRAGSRNKIGKGNARAGCSRNSPNAILEIICLKK